MDNQKTNKDKENVNPIDNVTEVEGPKIYTIESEKQSSKFSKSFPTFTFLLFAKFLQFWGSSRNFNSNMDCDTVTSNATAVTARAEWNDYERL